MTNNKFNISELYVLELAGAIQNWWKCKNRLKIWWILPITCN